MYARILMAQEHYEEAASRFNIALAAIEADSKSAKFTKADVLYQRGLSKNWQGKWIHG